MDKVFAENNVKFEADVRKDIYQYVLKINEAMWNCWVSNGFLKRSPTRRLAVSSKRSFPMTTRLSRSRIG